MGFTWGGERGREEGGSYWRRKPAKDFCRVRGVSLPDVTGPMGCKIVVGQHHEIRADGKFLQWEISSHVRVQPWRFMISAVLLEGYLAYLSCHKGPNFPNHL